MISLIINADDYGYSELVNRAIADAINRGEISSTSILANGPAFGADHLPEDISLGVHLNLTEFAPLRPSKELACLLNNNGLFFRKNLKNEYISGPLARAIYAECCAQIEYIRGFGIDIAHLDSHHQVHVNPRLLLMLRSLQKRYDIPRIRSAWNVWAEERLATRVLRCARRAWVEAVRFRSSVRMTDFFSDFTTIYRMQTLLPEGSSVEAMVHPGHPKYESEMELLRFSGCGKRSGPFTVVRYGSL